MGKIEQIGKVNLDLTYYSGEDMYCDGAVEDELLQIVRDFSEAEYPRIIEERKSWEVLYHLSAQRENIVEWLPVDKNMRVLEIGAGCGAITGVLSRKAGSVTCVDLSKKRSMINACRHKDCDNITIHVGNFQDIEPSLPDDYDYICLIGVFEYAESYMDGDAPFENFLHIVKRHLKESGRIVIAIENKFGLKYWAGCKEDHVGKFFAGIEGYPDGGAARTFTRSGLETIFRNCAVDEYAFYYPYPDYKFMVSLYSDEYLPKTGELSQNLRNFDRDRLVLFDERRAFDNILREGLFSLYSNSYLVVLGKKPDTCYVKYSNDRKKECQIRTEILSVDLPVPEAGEDRTDKKKGGRPGHLIVRKHPMCPEAEEHIRGIGTAYRKLKDRYAGGKLRINRCKLVEREQALPYIELEYIQGVTLSELLDACMEQNDMDAFMCLFRKYLAMLTYRSEVPVTDFDFIFSNILLNAEDAAKPFDALTNSVWTLIDYEWTFEKPVDVKELAFRAIHCYLLEDEKRNKPELKRILREIDVSEEEAEEYRAQEDAFQHFVTDRQRSMVEIWRLIGHKCFDAKELAARQLVEDHSRRIQIFPDRGQGFRAEDSFFIDQWECLAEDENDPGHLIWEAEVEVGADVQNLRIDPTSDPCIVRVRELRWNGVELPGRGKDSVLATNGIKLGDTGSFVFLTDDPNLLVSLAGQTYEEKNTFKISFERSMIEREIASDIISVADQMNALLMKEESKRRRGWPWAIF